MSRSAARRRAPTLAQAPTCQAVADGRPPTTRSACGGEAGNRILWATTVRMVEKRRVRVGDAPPAHGARHWLHCDGRIEASLRLILVKIQNERESLVEERLRAAQAVRDWEREVA